MPHENAHARGNGTPVAEVWDPFPGGSLAWPFAAHVAELADRRGAGRAHPGSGMPAAADGIKQ